jgi:hypothetical protein
LSEEDLIELVNCGLNLDELNGDSDRDLDINSLPFDIRAKFERAVQRGELSHMVQQWRPFWLSNNDGGQLVIDDTRTLDERILSLPVLLDGNESKTPKIHLEYNVCEVLFMAAWTLRLYHSPCEIIQSITGTSKIAVEASLFLQSTSQVLAHDARYENLQHVLMDCCHRTKQDMIMQRGIATKDESEEIHWRTLAYDLICICKSRRMVLKVLFTLYDMIDGARNKLKQSHEKDSRNSRKSLFLVMKKMLYFLSWCQTYWDSCSEDIVICIEEWIKDWDLEGKDAAHSIQDAIIFKKTKTMNNIEITNSLSIKLPLSNDQQVEKPTLVPIKTKQR